MKKKLFIAGLVLFMGFLMTACGNSSSAQNEAAMNTIQSYDLSEEQYELMSVVAPDALEAITQFTVDETYKSVCVGYDYYEKGQLVAKNCAESEIPFSYDFGPQNTYGKIYAYIDNNIDEELAVINILGKGSDVDETDSTGSKSPLSNDNQSFNDMESYTESVLLEPVATEKNKKIYIRAEIGDSDEDFEVSGDISSLMSHKKMLASIDKAFVFYAIFK